MKKVLRLMVLLTALTPIVVAPSVLSPFLSGKTLFIRAIVALIALLSVVYYLVNDEFQSRIIERSKEIVRNPLAQSIVLLFVVMGITTVLAFRKEIAFTSDAVRQEGYVGILSVGILSFFYVLLLKHKDWQRYFILSIISSFILLCVEFFQAVKGMRRPEALIGNSIFLATHYLFSLFCIGVLIVKNRFMRTARERAIVYCMAVLAVLVFFGILLTKSRGVLVGLFIGMIIASIYAYRVGGNLVLIGKKITVKKIAGVLMAALLVFSGLLVLTRESALWKNIPGINRIVAIGSQDATTQSRLVMARATYQAFLQEPVKQKLFGWGQDNFIFAWNKYYTPDLFSFDSGLFDRAHNKLLDMLIMHGIIGLLSYLFLWVMAFLAVVKLRVGYGIRTMVLLFLVSYFIANLFAFDTLVTYINFFAVLAFIMSYDVRHA